MAKRFTRDGTRIPTGVCEDKERGCWRATYKGWSVKCPTLEDAIDKRKELARKGEPHPSYVARMKKKKQKLRG